MAPILCVVMAITACLLVTRLYHPEYPEGRKPDLFTHRGPARIASPIRTSQLIAIRDIRLDDPGCITQLARLLTTGKQLRFSTIQSIFDLEQYFRQNHIIAQFS